MLKDLRDLNRIIGFIPAFPMLCYLIIAMYGILTFKEIPKYGGHPNPSSLNLAWLDGVAFFPMLLSFITIPISIFLYIHLKLNGIHFRKSDIFSLFAMLSAISCFLTLKYCAPSFFNWIID